MLDFYFTYRGVLRSLRSGALGHEMDRIAAPFFQLGYKRASAKIYIGRLARFSDFAAGAMQPLRSHKRSLIAFSAAF
jgi:integrase/recombinase XerD